MWMVQLDLWISKLMGVRGKHTCMSEECISHNLSFGSWKLRERLQRIQLASMVPTHLAFCISYKVRTPAGLIFLAVVSDNLAFHNPYKECTTWERASEEWYEGSSRRFYTCRAHIFSSSPHQIRIPCLLKSVQRLYGCREHFGSNILTMSHVSTDQMFSNGYRTPWLLKSWQSL